MIMEVAPEPQPQLWGGSPERFESYRTELICLTNCHQIALAGRTFGHPNRNVGMYPESSLQNSGYAQDRDTGQLLFIGNQHGEIIPVLQLILDKGGFFELSRPLTIVNLDFHQDCSQPDKPNEMMEPYTSYTATWQCHLVQKNITDSQHSFNLTPYDPGEGIEEVRDIITERPIPFNDFPQKAIDIVSVDLDVLNPQQSVPLEVITAHILETCKRAKAVMVFMSPGFNRNVPASVELAQNIFTQIIKNPDQSFRL